MMKNNLKRAAAIILAGVMCMGMSSIWTMAESNENTEVKAILGGYYNGLLNKGIIAENVNVTPSTAGDHGKIEEVEVLGKHTVIVTLEGYYPNMDISDIKLSAYNSDWYKLSPKVSDRITVRNSAVTRNSKGQTVIIYDIEQNIDDNRLEDYFAPAKVTDKDALITKADNYMSWQMDHGGWDKGVSLHESRQWDGSEPKNTYSGWTSKDGTPLGTIDNDSTYTQMKKIAEAYYITGEAKYKESVKKGLDFIFKLQYESGGLAQVYPKRGNYSDYVTFNDNAMINTLIMLEDMRDGNYPFDTDILSDEDRAKIDVCINKAVDYILKAQIVSQGKKTAWCAQHDPVTYKPKEARAYELPSISGAESVSIIKFLMHQKQTPEIKEAVDCAVEWFRESAVNDMKYVAKPASADGHFVHSEGSRIWYRFYEIGTNKAMFCDRDGIVKYDITEVGEERRTGYAWAGVWADGLLNVIDNYGYYPNKIQAQVVNTKSVDTEGKNLEKNQLIYVTNENLSAIIGDNETTTEVTTETTTEKITETTTETTTVTDTEATTEVTTVTETDTETTTETVTHENIYGDADGDGILSGNDCALIMQYVLNKSSVNISEETIEIIDVDGNGIITANDAAEVLSKVLNGSYVFSRDR